MKNENAKHGMAEKMERLEAINKELLTVCKAIASESRAGLRWSASNIIALNVAITRAEKTAYGPACTCDNCKAERGEKF